MIDFLSNGKPNTPQAIVTIVHSSSVRMTRTKTRPAAEITPSFAAFRFSSSSIPKNVSPLANPGADRGGVFSDATSEDERVQAAQCRRESADPLFDLVAKYRDRLSGPHILHFAPQQVAHVGSGFRYPEEPGFEIDSGFRARQRPTLS
jgi:hypothetical protein